MSHIDIPIDISWMPDLPYRTPTSISDIDLGSYLVTPGPACRGGRAPGFAPYPCAPAPPPTPR